MGGGADMASPTAYQLFIEVAVPLRLTVGRLGCFDFPAGEYVYTGSARRNLEGKRSFSDALPGSIGRCQDCVRNL